VNEFTGERVIPGQVNPDLWNEHYSRYAFAARYASGKRVLDAGCGAGYGAAELAGRARAVIGLDISAQAIEYASTNFTRDNLAFLVASAARLPIRSESLDLIAAFEVIEHLPDWRPFLDEAGRVLAPDGILIVSTPNKSYYAESRKIEGPNPFHEHEFEAPEFVAELRRAFGEVTLLLQNRAECLVFYPPKTFWQVDARLEGSAGSADDAHFLLAVCARTRLPPLHSFVYVPRAVNVLREREQYIELLKTRVTDLVAERDALLATVADLNGHLQGQNRWALQLEHDLSSAQGRIVELQEQYEAQTQASIALAQELREEIQKRTEWALETDRRLNAEIERVRRQASEILQALETTQASLEERTQWALDLQKSLEHLNAKIAMARTSRWLRIGRKAGVGPEL
jgi:SAM-dependent methyltransferase